MIISFSRQFVFLKTRKTAGTSTEIALRDICSDQDILTPLRPEEIPLTTRGSQNNLFPFRYWPLREKIRWFLGDREVTNRPLCGFANHTPAAEVARRYPEQFDHFLKIGNIRNPFDQQVSLYFWRTRKVATPPTFEEWMHTQPAPRLNNWEIITNNSVLVLDVALRYENLQEDLTSLARRMEAPLRELPSAKGGVRQQRDYRSFYSSTTKKLVESWYHNELSAFGYSFSWAISMVLMTAAY